MGRRDISIFNLGFFQRGSDSVWTRRDRSNSAYFAIFLS